MINFGHGGTDCGAVGNGSTDDFFALFKAHIYGN